MLTTLYISSQEVKLVSVKGKKIECWNRALESGIVLEGRVINPERLGEVIAEMFKSQNVPRNKVIVAISGLPYSYRIIEFPVLRENQVEEAVMRAVPDEFTIPIEDLYLSWARLNTRADGADYFVLGVDRDLVDSFKEAMKIASIQDWSMDLKPLALARAANATDAIVASLDVDHLDIVLMRDGYIKELHSAVIDHDNKKNEVTFYMGQFVTELVKVLSFHNESRASGDSENELADLPILVAGEVIAMATNEQGAMDETQVTAMLSKLTGHSVSLIAPPVEGLEKSNANAYATNIGLYLKTRRVKTRLDAATFHDVNIDILAGKFVHKPVLVPMWYLVAPVVIFIAIFGAWSLNTANAENTTAVEELKVQLEQLTITHNQMQQKAAAQVKIAQQVTAATENLKSIKNGQTLLLTGKGESVPCVADLRSNLPENGGIKQLRINRGIVEVNGTVPDVFEVITYIRSLQKAGYSPDLKEIDTDTDAGFKFTITMEAVPLNGAH
jgi:Tfp pilus assembly PilM family ATPase